MQLSFPLQTSTIKWLLLLAVASLLSGCDTAYYGAMEKVGIHKRDILRGRIEEVQDAQVDAKDQFSSALERFTQEIRFDGGDLQAMYDTLNDEYEDSNDRAEVLSARIDAVESVAEDLFDEWNGELGEYSNASLRRQSEAQLRSTRKQYQRMLKSMRQTEAKMTPILQTMHDQVLYLKHNLNARAIASLETEFGGLKRDIANLIRDMESSIREADQFMAAFKQ